MPVEEKKKIEEQQQESGLQAQQPQAQWQPMQTKEMPAEASYSDLVNEAKDANKATFDSLRETSAKDLLNANIQTELAKVAASKQLSTKMNAMGLGNSGYAGVGAGQIQSAYMQGMQNNQATYQDALRDIAMKENALAREDALRQQDINREDRIRVEDYNDNVNYKNATMAYEDALRGEAREQALADREATWKRDDEVAARDLANRKELLSYENSLAKENVAEQEEASKQAEIETKLVDDVATAAGKANSKAEIEQVLKDYKVTATRENGSYVFSGEGAENLSESLKRDLASVLRDAYNATNPPVNSLADMVNAGITTEAGNAIDKEWGVKDEIETLFNSADGKALAQEGSIVKLQNNRWNSKGKDYVYLQYDGGAWRKVSEADINKDDVTATIKGKDNIVLNKTNSPSYEETIEGEGNNADNKPAQTEPLQSEETINSKVVKTTENMSGKDAEDLAKSFAKANNIDLNKYANDTTLLNLQYLFKKDSNTPYAENTLMRLRGNGDDLYLKKSRSGWGIISKSQYDNEYGSSYAHRKYISYGGQWEN